MPAPRPEPISSVSAAVSGSPRAASVSAAGAAYNAPSVPPLIKGFAILPTIFAALEFAIISGSTALAPRLAVFAAISPACAAFEKSPRPELSAKLPAKPAAPPNIRAARN